MAFGAVTSVALYIKVYNGELATGQIASMNEVKANTFPVTVRTKQTIYPLIDNCI